MKTVGFFDCKTDPLAPHDVDDPWRPGHAAGPIYVQTSFLNHALATWAGDVASAATNYTICVDFLKFSASYDQFFKDLAEDSDLEGDIDAYAVWAAQNSAPGAPVPLQLNLPLSEVLMQYYRLKNTPGGQGRANRFEIFANFYGANVKAQKMQNWLAFQAQYSSLDQGNRFFITGQTNERGNAGQRCKHRRLCKRKTAGPNGTTPIGRADRRSGTGQHRNDRTVHDLAREAALSKNSTASAPRPPKKIDSQQLL